MITGKPSIKERLKQSIAEEKDSVEDRFKKAKDLFDSAIPEEKLLQKERPVTKSFTLLKEEIKLLQDIRLELANRGHLITQSDVIKMALKALDELGPTKHELLARIKSARGKDNF